MGTPPLWCEAVRSGQGSERPLTGEDVVNIVELLSHGLSEVEVASIYETSRSSIIDIRDAQKAGG